MFLAETQCRKSLHHTSPLARWSVVHFYSAGSYVVLLESEVVQNVNDDIVKLHVMCYDIVCLHSVWNYVVLLESG